MVRASVKKTKFKKLTFSESIKECRDATNPLLPSFEMEILEGLAVIQDKKLEVWFDDDAGNQSCVLTRL